METLEYVGPREHRKESNGFTSNSVDADGVRHLYSFPSGVGRAYAAVDRVGDSYFVEGSGLALLSPGYERVVQNIGPIVRIVKIDRFSGLFATDEHPLAARILNGAIRMSRPMTRFEADKSLFLPVKGTTKLHDGDVIRFGSEDSPYLFRFREQ